MPRISLEQWRALVAVVDAGGYAQAAAQLHKSQSAVTYAVQKLEHVLGVRAFELVGRKAVLTPTGQLLYRRAQGLLDEALRLEGSARSLAAGWEPQLRIAAEIIVPTGLLLSAFAHFGEISPNTRIELVESVLGGTAEALQMDLVDLAITPVVPPGFQGEPLMHLRFLPVAHPDHPLHQLGRPLHLRDLRKHRHIVVRDSGSQRTSKAQIEAEQRWVVSQMSTSIQAVSAGHGFAWFLEEQIREGIARGELKPLPLQGNAERRVDIYLVLADPEFAGPGVRQLADCLRTAVRQGCAQVRSEAELPAGA